MTPQAFLQDLIDSQDLTVRQEKDLIAHKDEITKFLRKEFGEAPSIKYAGSYEKGTMISDCYDLDIVCYFPSEDSRTLKEIREDVAKHLAQEYLVRPKASAERILDLKGATAPRDFHIDIVPGRFIADSKDVFLHVQYGDKERMQTNLKTHITHIATSGCVPIIRLVKLWAHRNNVNIKTFVLELFVVDVLTGSGNKASLRASFLQVMRAFENDFAAKRLEDPANSNNVVSQLMSESEKGSVAQAARVTLASIATSDDLAMWQSAFGEARTGAVSGPAVAGASSFVSGSSFAPPRQWLDQDDQRD